MTWEESLIHKFQTDDKRIWLDAAKEICTNDSGSNSLLEYVMAELLVKLLEA